MRNGKPCGAKTRTGDECIQKAMPNGRCRMHGGMSLAGIASPTFVNGRHSKYLPPRLMERYQESIADPELLNLREDIALLDARIADLLKRVDSGESAEAWKKAQAAWKAYNRAAIEEKQQLHDELGDLLSYGLADVQAWEELEHLLQDRRRLVESERKRLVEMQQNVTADQAMALMTALVQTVRQYVNDRNTLAAISTEFTRLVGGGSARTTRSA